MLVRVSQWSILQAEELQKLSSEDTKIIPASARRRLNGFGQQAGHLAADKIEESPLIVFASRYGDEERSLRILDEICQREPLSPMNFSLSVHNAVPGVLSIAWKLKEMQSVISASADTLVMGLTEAFSLLKSFPEKPVLMLYLDLPLPSIVAGVGDALGPIGACALLLHNGFVDGDAGIKMTAQMTDEKEALITSGEDHLQAMAGLLEKSVTQVTVGTETFGWKLDMSHE